MFLLKLGISWSERRSCRGYDVAGDFDYKCPGTQDGVLMNSDSKNGCNTKTVLIISIIAMIQFSILTMIVSLVRL